MTRPERNSERGRPFAARWLVMSLLCATLLAVAGCGDDDGAPPAAAATPTRTATPRPTATATPNLSQTAACAKLTACGQCFINAAGQCLSSDACVARLSADEAACINGVSGCNQSTLGDCLPPGCSVDGSSDECQ